jgi:DNA-binding transcriptional LysR family regulator
MRDPYVLLVPADHPVASGTTASLADVADLPLIGSSQCASGVFAEAQLASAGYPVDCAFRSDDNGTVQGLVAASYGAAFVPLLAVSPGDDRVAVMRLEPPVPPRTIAVVWHRDRHRSAATRALVEIAQQVAAGVEAALVTP